MRTISDALRDDSLWKQGKATTSPVNWWKSLCTNQPLRNLASKMLSIPPSSASAERIWSLYGGVHTSKRNRLTNIRAEKLVAVAAHLRLSKVLRCQEEQQEQSSDTALSSDDEHEQENVREHEQEHEQMHEHEPRMMGTSQPGVGDEEPEQAFTFLATILNE
jgi:hypothetical protein